MGKNNFIVTNYSPNPLSYSCPQLDVLVSSHNIGLCRVIPMALFHSPTHPTVIVDVHTVSVDPAVSSNVMACLLFTHLGFACPYLSTGITDPLLFTVFTCWSCWVKVATVAMRLAIVLHCDIMVSLSAACAVTRLMRESCFPSISHRLFAPWYPPARVETFCLLLNSCCAA